MNKKLIIQTRRVILVLKVLIILIPILAILSWIFSKNIEFSNFYLGPTIGNFIKGDFAAEISKFKWNNKLIGLAGSGISLLPLILGLGLLIRLFKSYSTGLIFTLENVKIYRKLGYLSILSALLFQPLSQLVLSIAVSINYTAGHRFIAISFDNTNMTALISGIFLTIIAHVMDIGHKINEEQELTI